MQELNSKNKLSLERNDTLKVFAVVSILKTVPEEVYKNKLALTLLVTYTEAEAVIGSSETLKLQGIDPELYKISIMRVQLPVQDIVDMPPPPPPPAPIQEQIVELKPAKTVEETMIDHARMIFNLVGNPAQQKMLNSVIGKFTEYTASKK